jgi:hypothetical protein
MINRFLIYLRAIPSPAGLGCLCLALFLFLFLPSFLCMPSHIDISFFSVCARIVVRGGILERDILFFWFPGMVWLLVGVQSVVGPSSEVFQLLDFLFFTGCVWLLTRWMHLSGVSRAGQVWAALALYISYFSINELVHCQPDVWMLFPALGALHLRYRQLRLCLVCPSNTRALVLGGFAEGLCWSAAVFFKPFAVIPVAACFVVSLICLGPTLFRVQRAVLLGVLGLASAIVLVAFLWLFQLHWSGGWPFFWQSLNTWGKEYYSTGASTFARARGLLRTLWPSCLVHVPALMFAILALEQSCLRLFFRQRAPLPLALSRSALFAAFYLGWVYQAIFIQFGTPYHVVPPLMLALVVVFQTVLIQPRVFLRLAALIAFLLLALPGSVLFDTGRVALWQRCVCQGSTPEMKDRLSRATMPTRPVWVDLYRVADQLRSMDIDDKELTCYGAFTSHLYLMIDRKPSNRFFFLPLQVKLFPRRQDEICRELTNCPQRYIVSDARHWSLQKYLEQDPETGTWHFSDKAPPALVKSFPWSEPIVYRSGPYLVHRVTGPVRKIIPDP